MKNRTDSRTDAGSAAVRGGATALALALLLPMALTLGGCNIAAPIYYVIEGPPKVPAATELEAGRTTVLFIDDRANRLPRRSLRNEIAQSAERVLLDRGIVNEGQLIASRAAMRVASAEDPDRPMPIVDVAREIGAEVIVYCEVESFTLSPPGAGLQPTVIMTVKVLDAVNNTRLFPASEMGYPLEVRLPARPGGMQAVSLSEKSALEREVARLAGIRVARLFFETERTPDLGT
jgi:hypothetical protein